MSKVYKNFRDLVTVDNTQYALVTLEERKFPYLSVTTYDISIYRSDNDYWRDLNTGDTLPIGPLWNMHSAFLARKTLATGIIKDD